MEETLYPIKFNPILKSKIWGGHKIEKLFNKMPGKLANIGESWEISGVQGDISIVSNGFLSGNTLEELTEIYMGDLVGDSVFEKFGIEFPLLIKFIEAQDNLSIQVHPDDEVAHDRHNSYGKTEMWYVLQADKDAKLISGFKKDSNKQEYRAALESGKLIEILNEVKVDEGDLFFIPSGRIHAIGKGTLLTEIQQTSDITYRIYDYNRIGDDGKPRELHTDLALDVIDFNATKSCKTDYKVIKNSTSLLIECPYFQTNIIVFDKEIEKDYVLIDSFVIYICVKGSFKIIYGNNLHEEVNEGETILIPASLKNVILKPETETKILEVYVPEK